MSLQNSPGFEQVKIDHVSDAPSPKHSRGWVRGIIIFLILTLTGLIFINYAGSADLNVLRGRGSVSGFVVDERGNAVKAEIIVAGTDLKIMTDDSGKFLLNDIPEGQRMLVVGYDLTGWEYPVVIIAGQTTEVGRISVVTTQTPD